MRERQWSRWLKKALLLQTYVGALLIGIFSLHFDFKKLQIASSRFWQIYAAIMNIFVLALMPIAFQYALKANNFFGNNTLMRIVHFANTGVRFSFIAGSVIFRVRRERYAMAIVTQLMHIERDYFNAVPVKPHIQWHFDRLFYAKYCSMCFQVLTACTTLFAYPQHFTAWWWLLCFYAFITLNIMHGVMFHYFVALIHMCKRFQILNSQLEEMFKILQQLQMWPYRQQHPDQPVPRAKPIQMQQLQQSLAAQIDTVAQLHYRLTNLVYEHNECYKYQIIAVLVSRVCNAVAHGYYGLILSTTEAAMDTDEIVFGAIRYAMTIFDSYLVDIAYDSIAKAYQHTAEILKDFSELGEMDINLERSCNLLSQQLMQRKLEIKICGLFVLNKSASLTVFGEIIKHTIFLVQYDVANIPAKNRKNMRFQ